LIQSLSVVTVEAGLNYSLARESDSGNQPFIVCLSTSLSCLLLQSTEVTEVCTSYGQMWTKDGTNKVVVPWPHNT